jgi:RNA polymerase sigma-70 factor (ECF subfamily)
MYKEKEDFLADQSLIGQVLSGDANAFAHIIKKTERLVAGIVFKMIANPEERRDVAQDIYIKSFRKLGSFRFQSKLSTWIGQIAFNTCKNHIEKKKLVLFDISLRVDGTGLAVQKEFGSRTDIYKNETEINIHRRELSSIMAELIEGLPTLYKTLITLYHYEDLSYSEIAQITELPEGTVKNYLFRARRMLKEIVLKKFKNEAL